MDIQAIGTLEVSKGQMTTNGWIISVQKQLYSKLTWNTIKIFENQVYYLMDILFFLQQTCIFRILSSTQKRDPWNALQLECFALPMNLSSRKKKIFFQMHDCTPENEKNSITLKRIFWICKPLYTCRIFNKSNSKWQIVIQRNKQLRRTTQDEMPITT